MTTRTAIYIRVSSQVQADSGASLSDQLKRLQGEALGAGEIIVGIYIDQARSGNNIAGREEYQRLVLDMQNGLIDVVRMESVDRGHRNDSDRRAFEAVAQHLNVRIVYSGEPQQQAPQHRKFHRGLLGLLAELESDEASQRTYKRHLFRAREGRWRGGYVPYGLQSDGEGWFKPDPETYPVLLWILERRAEGLGYYKIACLLNAGISLHGEDPAIPLTPGLLNHRRRPYTTRQDPETGATIRIPKKSPDGRWQTQTVWNICRQAIDGVYAGILNWGQSPRRFKEDSEGRPKEPVSRDTGRPLIPEELVQRLRAVKTMEGTGEIAATTAKNTYLLSHLVHCGHCGQSMHGYTTSKYKQVQKQKVCYKYRKYRCAGRANKAGSCTMTILDAERLEQVVVQAVFADTARWSPDKLRDAFAAAVTKRRRDLQLAIEELDRQRRELEQLRDEALDAFIRDRQSSATIRQALSDRAEDLIKQLDELARRRKVLELGIQDLDKQARKAHNVVAHPDVDPERWQEPGVFKALQRALKLIVRRIEVVRQAEGRYQVKIWLPAPEDLLEVSEFVVNLPEFFDATAL
jgi:site-specific DNA recombinase